MGRLLETLKTRDSLRPPRPTAADQGVAAPRTAAVAPPAPVPATEPSTADWPFIEVPDTRPPAADQSPPIEPNHRTVSTNGVNGATAPPHVSFHRRLQSPLDDNGSVARELVVWRDPAGAAAVQYRQVAESLRGALAAEHLRSLVLLPVEGEPSQSASAVNLALALAANGGKTLLIDTDRRARHVDRLLGVAAAPGWAEVVQGMTSGQALQETGWHRLHVLAAGNRLAGAAAPLLSQRTPSLLAELTAHYELVLVHASPWEYGGLSALLTHACDAVCLLLDKKQVDQPAEARCLKTLQTEQVRVLGSVVTSQETPA